MLDQSGIWLLWHGQLKTKEIAVLGFALDPTSTGCTGFEWKLSYVLACPPVNGRGGFNHASRSASVAAHPMAKEHVQLLTSKFDTFLHLGVTVILVHWLPLFFF